MFWIIKKLFNWPVWKNDSKEFSKVCIQFKPWIRVWSLQHPTLHSPVKNHLVIQHDNFWFELVSYWKSVMRFDFKPNPTLTIYELEFNKTTSNIKYQKEFAKQVLWVDYDDLMQWEHSYILREQW